MCVRLVFSSAVVASKPRDFVAPSIHHSSEALVCLSAQLFGESG
jgi:hypothetical protein